MSNQSWTDEDLAKLRLLLANDAKLSASDIAIRMGRSRNTIVGKVKRLGLKLAHAGNHAPPRLPRKRSVVAEEEWPRYIAANEATGDGLVGPPLEIAPANAVAFFDLHSGMCKYVVSGVKPSEFKFCGAQTGDASRSWCAHHSRVVYTPYYRNRYPGRW